MSDQQHPASDGHDGHDGHEHHGSLGVYLLVAVALCVLTACSFWTYSQYWPSALDNDAIKRLFMMAVSCTKAMLVIMFFMHLLWEANWKWVLTIPATCMSIFLGLALVPDVGLRMRHASQERWLHAAEPRPVAVLQESDDGSHSEHAGESHESH